MSRVTKRKEHPLSMRLPEADIAIIDRAADLRGWSRIEFVREAAVRAAEDTLMENLLLRMSPQGFKAFTEAIMASPKKAPELVKPFKHKAPWEKSRTRT